MSDTRVSGSATTTAAEPRSPAGSESATPVISVVVPAFRCAAQLAQCLGALRNSTLLQQQRLEIIVVDDGSRDDTATVAARIADAVVAVPDGPRGPAHARNTGAAVARGDILLFVDADVVVHQSTVAGFAALFARDSGLSAAFGAYDAHPAAPGFISQYRNLLHHFVHLQNAGPSATFWAGCGAVRRQAFLDVGGFDALRYRTPQVEDIELGYRLTDSGRRITLAPALQATHLKRWTLRSMLRTDLRARAIPWMHLLLDRRDIASRGSLNVQRRDKVLTALSALAVVALLAGLATSRGALVAVAFMCLLAIPFADLKLLRDFARARGVLFAAGVVPLRAIFYLVSATGAAWAVATHWTTGGRRDIATGNGQHVTA